MCFDLRRGRSILVVTIMHQPALPNRVQQAWFALAVLVWGQRAGY
jgi:hypothetical protein